jgi:hypothetical protein
LGLTSSLYSTTLTLTQGTNNEITNIIIPTTIHISSDTIQAGDTFTISGSASPYDPVKVYVVGQGAAATLQDSQILTATSSARGLWSTSPDSQAFSKGTYGTQALIIRADQSKSPASKMLTFAVGANTSAKASHSDVNGDGKVNLVDFSILLSFWNTADPVADINGDGVVNLGDFSIMLFNWTG